MSFDLSASKFPLIAIFVLLLNSCTSFSNANKQTVIVETPMVEGVECDLTDNIGNRWGVSQTPEAVTISNGHGPMTLECYKNGYKKTVVQIKERYPHEMPIKEYQYMVRTGVSFVKDFTHDVGKRYPNVLVVLMEPRSFQDEEERIDWLAAKQSYEKMYQEPSRSDRIAELVKVEKNMEQMLEERKNVLQAKVEQELKGEAFIDRNRRIAEYKKNISTNAAYRKSMRRKILDHYREKLGFQPVEQTQDIQTEIVKKEEMIKNYKGGNPEKAHNNIKMLKELLDKTKKNQYVNTKQEESSISKQAIIPTNNLKESEKEALLPISIIPRIPFLTK